MGAIKFPHASGNSMSIAAPATNPASDLELKLPATVGTAGQVLQTDGAGTLSFTDTGLPCFFAQASNQINIPEYTNTQWNKLDFGTEKVDSGSQFASNTFTPTTAGYYYVWTQITLRLEDDAHAMHLAIYKNGSLYTETYTNGRNSDYHNWYNQATHGIVSMNGSGDYLDAYVSNNADSGTTTIPVTYRHFGAFRLGPN
jgi:hypothetical protein